MNRAMDRIKRKNQSKVEADLAKSESLQTIIKIHSKGRSETVRYAKSGKIMDIAKKLEMQMGKGDSENSNKIIENKDENSNIVEIVSAQPIIKKKKKNKIIFNYEDQNNINKIGKYKNKLCKNKSRIYILLNYYIIIIMVIIIYYINKGNYYMLY